MGYIILTIKAGHHVRRLSLWAMHSMAHLDRRFNWLVCIRNGRKWLLSDWSVVTAFLRVKALDAIVNVAAALLASTLARSHCKIYRNGLLVHCKKLIPPNMLGNGTGRVLVPRSVGADRMRCLPTRARTQIRIVRIIKWRSDPDDPGIAARHASEVFVIRMLPILRHGGDVLRSISHDRITNLISAPREWTLPRVCIKLGELFWTHIRMSSSPVPDSGRMEKTKANDENTSNYGNSMTTLPRPFS